MGLFDQLKNISPQQIQQAQQAMDQMIEKKVGEEIEKRGLVTREELERILDERD